MTTAEPILKVAQVIGRLSVGGAERHFVSLCNALRNCEVHAVFVSPDQRDVPLRDELQSDVEQHDVPVRRRSFFQGAAELRKVFDDIGVDVVHSHMFWPGVCSAMARPASGQTIFVTTEHGENHWKRWYHRMIERRLISSRADARFCVSQDILDRRRDADGVPESLLEIVANGTPVPDTTVLRSCHGPFVIGSLGRLVPQKNFCLFVDAIAELRGRGHDVSGCIVGDGPERSAIETHARRRSIEDYVDLPGFDTNTDARLRSFDIYLNSSAQEGQPISLLEAMAYGLPIVACDVGAIASTVRSGHEGIIVAPGDLTAMTDALERILKDESLRRTLGDCGRQRVIREFSIDAVAGRYRQRYLELLNAGEAPTVERSRAGVS